MTTGYQLRNTPNIIEGGWDMFNINRPQRRTFDQWMADFQKLSGQRDVSQDDLTLTDAQIQEAFAESYALAEMAEGRHREQYPDDPTET